MGFIEKKIEWKIKITKFVHKEDDVNNPPVEVIYSLQLRVNLDALLRINDEFHKERQLKFEYPNIQVVKILEIDLNIKPVYGVDEY
jgi:hypothetical protein